ncbi:hypothetical protein B0H14DRAFT_2970844 [Mycena olivaceomarginata]|nr:hypothetical protein B0H14DRAFT_2970844 [Mycena olivaceomarginata]
MSFSSCVRTRAKRFSPGSRSTSNIRSLKPWRQRETDSCCSLTSLTAISTSRCWIKRSSEEMADRRSCWLSVPRCRNSPSTRRSISRRSRCSSSTRRSSRWRSRCSSSTRRSSRWRSRCSSPNSFLISSISCLKIPTTMSRSRSMVWIRSLSRVFLAAGRSCGLGRSTTRPLCGLLESRPTSQESSGSGAAAITAATLAILDGTRTAINRSALVGDRKITVSVAIAGIREGLMRAGGSGTASRRAGRHGQGWRSAKEGRRRKGTARTHAGRGVGMCNRARGGWR